MADDKAPDLTAGTYLRKRREATGMTIDEAARWAIRHPDTSKQFAARLVAFEDDKDVAGTLTLQQLRAAFSFDTEVYLALAAGSPAGTMLCRKCACSWHDPCLGRCSWVEPDLCSACADTGDAEEVDEPLIEIGAGDPFGPGVLTIMALLHEGRAHDAAKALSEIVVTRMSRTRSDRAAAAIYRDAADRMNRWRLAQPTAAIEEPVHV